MGAKIAQIIRKNILLILILLLSFALRLIFSIENLESLFIDISAYHNTAMDFINKGIWDVGVYHAPGYPAFIALVYLFYSKSYLGVYLVQCLIGTASTYLIYKLGKDLFNKGTGLVGAAFSLVYWPLWLYSGILLAETLFIFLLLMCINFFLIGMQNDKKVHFALAGVFLALSILTRSINMPLILVLPLFYLVYARKDLKTILKNSLLFIIVACLVIAPWPIRNFAKYGEFIPVDTLMGLNLLAGNNDRSVGLYSMMSTEERLRLVKAYTKDGQAGKEVEANDKYMREAAITCILNDPARFIRNTFRRAEIFLKYDFMEIDWVPEKYMAQHYLFKYGIAKKAEYASNIFFYLTGLAGLLLLAVKRTKKILVLLLFIIYYFILTIPFYISQRYRLPIMPFLSISAGCLMYLPLSNIKQILRQN